MTMHLEKFFLKFFTDCDKSLFLNTWKRRTNLLPDNKICMVSRIDTVHRRQSNIKIKLPNAKCDIFKFH